MSSSASTTAAYTGVVMRPEQVAVDLLFVPVFEDESTPDDVGSLDEATNGEIGRARASGEFRGKAYEVFVTPIVSGWKARRVGCIGAGKVADWVFSKKGARLQLSLSGHIALDDENSYVAAAEAGLGIAQIPAFVLKESMERGTLDLVLGD